MRLNSTSGGPTVGASPSLNSECIWSNQTQAIKILFPDDASAGLMSSPVRAGTAFGPGERARPFVQCKASEPVRNLETLRRDECRSSPVASDGTNRSRV